MGILVGLLFGLGAFLCVTRGSTVGRGRPSRWWSAVEATVRDAGLSGVRARQVVLASAGLAAVSVAAVVTVSAAWSVSIAFGVFGGLAPWLYLQQRASKRRREERELWPYVVDDLASSIRAGLSLPEAVAGVAERGPEPLRPPFARFAVSYRATGSFSDSLDRLAADAGDPFADRVVQALRLARDVGGTDVGRILRTLAQALREDLRARGEIEARQSWTVNGARLALAAPWVVLLLLASRSSSARVYDEPSGLIVLAVGAVLSVISYALMRRIGRLPGQSPRRTAPQPVTQGRA